MFIVTLTELKSCSMSSAYKSMSTPSAVIFFLNQSLLQTTVALNSSTPLFTLIAIQRVRVLGLELFIFLSPPPSHKKIMFILLHLIINLSTIYFTLFSFYFLLIIGLPEQGQLSCSSSSSVSSPACRLLL